MKIDLKTKDGYISSLVFKRYFKYREDTGDLTWLKVRTNTAKRRFSGRLQNTSRI